MFKAGFEWNTFLGLFLYLLKIEFFEGPCLCQAELVSTQIITLRDIPAQSAVKIKESYQFELDEEVGKIVEQEFNWG